MADTTTTLNVGLGGDIMDESLVTQASGTAAKRPRVVPGGDDGTLQSFEPVGRGTEALIGDIETRKLLVLILNEVRRLVNLTRILVSETTAGYKNIDDPELDAVDINNMRET